MIQVSLETGPQTKLTSYNGLPPALSPALGRLEK